MREITKTVYAYDELTNDAKEAAVKAVQAKLDGPWWGSSDTDDIANVIVEEFATQLGTPGVENFGPADFPGIDGVTLEGWSLDNGQYAIFQGLLTRDNAPKLPWVDGIDSVRLFARRAGTTATPQDGDGPDAPEQEHERMAQTIGDAIHAAVKAGADEAEYKTSESAAREWCENNEVQEYLADGQLAD